MFIQDKQFSLYREDCFSTISWQEIFKDRRVLVCSLTRFPQSFIKIYIKHLEIYSQLYKLLGVDEVYFLVRDSNWTLVNGDMRSKILTTLGDVDSGFVQQLAEQQNITSRTPKFLSRYWNFQVLINNGNVERIDQQPVDNYFKQFLRDTKNVDAIQRIGPKNENFIWSPTFLKFSPLAKDIYYYRLHPNRGLKQYLFDTSKKS